MKEESAVGNPMICDPIEGVCSMPVAGQSTELAPEKSQWPVKVVYFSDPVCSACWGVEPTLRRLQLEYGSNLEIEYHMGGLLPSWKVMGSRVNPAMLASHSEEMGRTFGMPMNGEVWLQDPPQSSYPPSIAFKAAQLQDVELAKVFLRRIREDLYVRSINISKWEHIERAAMAVGLDAVRLKADYEAVGQQAFDDDLRLAQKMGVRGFPCFFLGSSNEQSETIYGAKPYAEFQEAIRKVAPQIVKVSHASDWKSLFDRFGSMTLREFVELGGMESVESKSLLDKLTDEGSIRKLSTRNGDLWTRII